MLNLSWNCKTNRQSRSQLSEKFYQQGEEMQNYGCIIPQHVWEGIGFVLFDLTKTSVKSE